MKCLTIGFVACVLLGCRPHVDGIAKNAPTTTGTPKAATDRWEPLFVDIENRQFRPFEESGVKAVVLVFVLHECPIANAYIPKLNELDKTFGRKGFRMFIVESDPYVTLEQARDHAGKYGITAPVLLDTEHTWAKRAGATKTPEVAIFSATGQIMYRGRIDDQYADLGKRRMQSTSHDMEDALAAILADQAIVRPRTEVIGCYIPELPKKGK